MDSITLQRQRTQRKEVELSPEQHRFELYGFAYMQIFFSKYVLQYHSVLGWLTLGMWNHRYRGTTVKLYVNFQLCSELVPQHPCCSRVTVYASLDKNLLIFKQPNDTDRNAMSSYYRKDNDKMYHVRKKMQILIINSMRL